jgi:hypothetical protein
MFRLNRAVWNASVAAPQTGMLVARGVAPDANTVVRQLRVLPARSQFSEVTSTDYTLDIKPMNATTVDLTGQIAVRYTSCRTSGHCWRRGRCCRATAAHAANNIRTPQSVQRRGGSGSKHRGRD